MPMLSGWWDAHGLKGGFPRALLPPLGIMVSDAEGPCAALWCYESFGVGVAFLEFPVSRPGLSSRRAADAFSTAVTGCMMMAGKLAQPPGEYRVFRSCTLPGIARVMQRMGFAVDSTPRVSATILQSN